MRLKEKVDTLIVVPNQKILQVIDKKTPVLDAFKKIDSVLHQGVKGIAELITLPGLINVDFADVKTIMSNSGTALMGMGVGSGEKRALIAIKQAIASPLLDVSIEGAKGVLFNVVGGPDLTMNEIDEAASIIHKTVDGDADIIFGAVIDEKMMDQVRITLIATRFDEGKLKVFGFPSAAPKPVPVTDESESLYTKPVAVSSQPPMVTSKDLYPEESKPSALESPVADTSYMDDDDQFDIPAFLRKKS